MWCEAGHEPDSFWRQTPLTFRLAMKAARARSEAKHDLQVAHAHMAAQFNAATKSKRGLKPLKHYLPKRVKARRQSPTEMLGAMKLIASRVNRQFEEKPDE